jgi:hypothetical protein
MSNANTCPMDCEVICGGGERGVISENFEVGLRRTIYDVKRVVERLG